MVLDSVWIAGAVSVCVSVFRGSFVRALRFFLASSAHWMCSVKVSFIDRR